ncbi:T9SS type A sorting domain-containing protein [candidate division KSB1 bacterium]|nr:T9SS type A sorting domain-containing protein [candidate division KSB1 bacterium]
MRRKTIVLVSILMGSWLSAGLVEAQQFRIMPLGNSITEGVQQRGVIDWGGYRDDLAEMLIGEGIDFDMVGSQDDGTDFYPRHEGHAGWNAYQIADNIAGWINTYTPNIFFFHIGTNDISAQFGISYIVDEIENTLDEIHDYNPNAVVFLASVIPRDDELDGYNDSLNDAIRQLIPTKQIQGYRLYYSAQHEQIVQNSNWKNDYMSDYLHPNDTGYHLMAEQFFNDFIANVNTSNSFMIAGDVRYYLNDEAVANVLLQVGEYPGESILSSADGSYEFNDLAAGSNYTITALKDPLSIEENLTHFYITTYSAALTLRYSLGLETLSGEQQVAADVDKDGNIFSYDAALIARYSVGLPRFADSHVGEWSFTPDSRSYSPPNVDKPNDDYTAILLGDVSGSYIAQGSLLAKQTEKDNWSITESYQTGDEFALYIQSSHAALLAYDILCDFPHDKLRLKRITLLAAVADFQLVQNASDKQVKVGLYSAQPSDASGDIIEIVFDVTAPFTEINIGSLEQAGEHSTLLAYQLSIPENTMPAQFVVHQNYPNPFNPETTISYELPEMGTVDINIFNIVGQHVKTVFSGTQMAGVNNIQWRGDNDFGQQVSSGVYLCQIRYQGIVKNIRMLKIE